MLPAVTAQNTTSLPKPEPYPHFFIRGEYGLGANPKVVDELDIINLSAQIREKPDWSTKIRDPAIISKWRSELDPNITQSDAKLDYVLAELDYYLSLRGPGPDFVEVGAVDGTWQSDSLIREELRQELISEVGVLEFVPDELKDWHPGSNNQILDLVHPSLHCFVNGRTPVLKKPFESHQLTDSQGVNFMPLHFPSDEELLPQELITKLAFDHLDKFQSFTKSKKFQWLPSEVQVDEKGSAHFTSYINNLHPEQYATLYTTLEKILTKFIPMFEKVLTGLRSPRENRIKLESSDWYEPTERENEDEDEEESEDEEVPRIFKPMPIPEFEAPSDIPADQKVNLRGRNLQVIVKLANIHLTPANLEYPGGAWHLEGMANEKIVASGIYYYSCDNVTESRLLFRQAIQEPDYEQYDTQGVDKVYGLQDEAPLNQNLGSIITKERRCIVFHNTLQHKVAPFQLEDLTRPGHRKILVFFLIDPTINILSTARVPPQQKGWFVTELDKVPTAVPELIVHKIVGLMDWPMELDEAKLHREELMKERKFFVKESNEELFERPFSLCEH